MFEFLQFAELTGVKAVLCVNFDEEMANLLEYMYGNASTVWGRVRVADGHPAKYSTNISFVCSNEEPQQATHGDFHEYLSKFNNWIRETKAAAISLGVWPLSVGVAMDSGAHRRFSPNDMNKYSGGSREMLKAIFDAKINDTEVIWDQHGDGGVAAGCK